MQTGLIIILAILIGLVVGYLLFGGAMTQPVQQPSTIIIEQEEPDYWPYWSYGWWPYYGWGWGDRYYGRRRWPGSGASGGWGGRPGGWHRPGPGFGTRPGAGGAPGGRLGGAGGAPGGRH